jgi:DHA1 family multidrug resistance protein-like MFS transporter
MFKQLPVESLTARERSRGLFTVMATWFLMHAGFFLIIPLLSVHYVDELGWAAAFIGIVLATRQFTQQGLTVFGGALADRFGSKGLIMLGVLIRTLSFVMMGYATVPSLLLLSGFLAAIGGALFDAPQKATVATLAPIEKQATFFAHTGILQNIARTVGPLIGAALIRFDFRVVGLGAAAFFFAAFLVTWFFLPSVEICTTRTRTIAGLRLAFSDRMFVVFTALLMGFWFMWVQLSIALPLEAKALTGDNSSVAVMFTVSAVLAILLQIPAIRIAQRFLEPLPTIVVGVLLMAFGLGTVALANSLFQLYASLFFFSLGTVLVMPNTQTVTAAMADERARGAYFGVSSLALAFGGGIGHVTGGWLVDRSAQIGWTPLPWLVFGLVGIVSAGGLAAFSWWQSHHLPAVAQPVAAAGD